MRPDSRCLKLRNAKKRSELVFRVIIQLYWTINIVARRCCRINKAHGSITRLFGARSANYFHYTGRQISSSHTLRRWVCRPGAHEIVYNPHCALGEEEGAGPGRGSRGIFIR